ncbi:hypothetical protein DRJ16_07135, partial [Candidatus Woesearchaeota archaeon]
MSAFYDTFQYHPNDDLTSADTIYGTVWSEIIIDNPGGSVGIVTGDVNNKKVRMSMGYNSGDNGGNVVLKMEEPLACSPYWSFYLDDVTYYDASENYYREFHINFYDSDGNLISQSDDLDDWLISYPQSQWELLKSGNNIGLYVNGTYIGDIGGTWDDTPCYIEFNMSISRFGNYARITIEIDNVMTTDNGVISTLPLDW